MIIYLVILHVDHIEQQRKRMTKKILLLQILMDQWRTLSPMQCLVSSSSRWATPYI
jgi:hypothetical protein